MIEGESNLGGELVDSWRTIQRRCIQQSNMNPSPYDLSVVVLLRPEQSH